MCLNSIGKNLKVSSIKNIDAILERLKKLLDDGYFLKLYMNKSSKLHEDLLVIVNNFAMAHEDSSKKYRYFLWNDCDDNMQNGKLVVRLFKQKEVDENV